MSAAAGAGTRAGATRRSKYFAEGLYKQALRVVLLGGRGKELPHSDGRKNMTRRRIALITLVVIAVVALIAINASLPSETAGMQLPN